jgi:hypothetical protein
MCLAQDRDQRGWGSCEHDNEPWDSITFWKVLE